MRTYSQLNPIKSSKAALWRASTLTSLKYLNIFLQLWIIGKFKVYMVSYNAQI